MADTATTEIVEVGEFTFAPSTGAITGPERFMRSEDFTTWKANIGAGTDVVFNYAIANKTSPSTAVALLVSLQTAYAAWNGSQRLLRHLDRASGCEAL